MSTSFATTLSALLALGASLPVHGTIHRLPPRQDEAAVKAEAQKAALAFPAVVGILARFKEPFTGCKGTGVFIGLSPDRATGYVLTCAHLFLEEGAKGKPLDLAAVERPTWKPRWRGLASSAPRPAPGSRP